MVSLFVAFQFFSYLRFELGLRLFGIYLIHKFIHEENQLSYSYISNYFIFYSRASHKFWMFLVSTGSVSDRECQLGLQKDLHREDRNADNGDPIAGNYRGCKETLHQFGKLKTSVSRYCIYIASPSRAGKMYNCTIFWRHFLVIFL